MRVISKKIIKSSSLTTSLTQITERERERESGIFQQKYTSQSSESISHSRERPPTTSKSEIFQNFKKKSKTTSLTQKISQRERDRERDLEFQEREREKIDPFIFFVCKILKRRIFFFRSLVRDGYGVREGDRTFTTVRCRTCENQRNQSFRSILSVLFFITCF